jgi:protein-disulfide isomerase
MKNKMFVMAALVIAFAGFGALVWMKKPAADQAIAPAPDFSASAPAPAGPVNLEKFVRPHSPTYGNALARVVVVEWFDPECEACRFVHPMVKKVVADYKDRVQFVLRYMPYHKNSMLAASALEEARELGKFDEALDLLFETQPLWGDHQNPRPELIGQNLAKLGIPKKKLEPEYLIKKHGAKIQMDEADGNQVGVRGTPSFFVNGRLLPQLGDQPLRLAIEQALAATKN